MQNIKADTKPLVYKTVWVEKDESKADKRKETVIRTGTHAECQAALDNAEKEALGGKGKYDLNKGHLALLVTDGRETATEAKPDAKAEKAKPDAKGAE